MCYTHLGQSSIHACRGVYYAKRHTHTHTTHTPLKADARAHTPFLRLSVKREVTWNGVQDPSQVPVPKHILSQSGSWFRQKLPGMECGFSPGAGAGM
jgi:hypothetical protein